MNNFFALLIGLGIFSHTAFASQINGKDLLPASDTALKEASVEVDENSIFAWEAIREEAEVVTKVLNEDDIQLTYGCHYHGQQMSCHEESIQQGNHHYHKDPEITLKFIKEGYQTAIAKFEKTLQRQGKDLSVMTSLKVWTHEDSHDGDGHEHGADVWTKIDYKISSEKKTIYVLCHVHGHDLKFSCHYRNSGENEPDLSFSKL